MPRTTSAVRTVMISFLLLIFAAMSFSSRLRPQAVSAVPYRTVMPLCSSCSCSPMISFIMAKAVSPVQCPE